MCVAGEGGGVDEGGLEGGRGGSVGGGRLGRGGGEGGEGRGGGEGGRVVDSPPKPPMIPGHASTSCPTLAFISAKMMSMLLGGACVFSARLS